MGKNLREIRRIIGRYGDWIKKQDPQLYQEACSATRANGNGSNPGLDRQLLQKLGPYDLVATMRKPRD